MSITGNNERTQVMNLEAENAELKIRVAELEAELEGRKQASRITSYLDQTSDPNRLGMRPDKNILRD